MDVRGERGRRRNIPAGIIAPLMVRGQAVGTLKFYFRSPRPVNRTQYALASGFAELLSTQLTVHELERQSELTARAEIRALQAQINPPPPHSGGHHRAAHGARAGGGNA